MGVKGTLYAAQEMLAGQKKEASRKGHGRYDGTWNWKEHDGWGGGGAVVIFSSLPQRPQRECLAG